MLDSIIIIVGLVLIIGLRLFEKKINQITLILSLILAFIMYEKQPLALLGLLVFLVETYAVVRLGFYLRDRKRTIYPLVTAASLLLVLTKLLVSWHLPFIGFVGISYMTFKVIQIIFEIYDGIIKQPIGLGDYLQFLLFFPTIVSGPIDRSRRFMEDIHQVLPRATYLELAGTGLFRLLLGIVYKMIISTVFYRWINDNSLTHMVGRVIQYMYGYSFYLFFDFAGYSLMAVGVSNLMGIQTPMNFNQPFRSIDIKDFWNRWHITLSTWLRDFVFSRLVMRSLKNKWFKTRLETAMMAYLVNMILMGVWHGVSWSYLIYGIYHGVLMASFEWYQKKSKFYKRNKQKRWYQLLSWAITIHLVMIGLLIFSGKPYDYLLKLWNRQ